MSEYLGATTLPIQHRVIEPDFNETSTQEQILSSYPQVMITTQPYTTTPLTEEIKLTLFKWIIEINEQSKDHFPMRSDRDKYIQVRTYLKENVKTKEDVKKWLNLVINLDLVDTSSTEWKRIQLYAEN